MAASSAAVSGSSSKSLSVCSQTTMDELVEPIVEPIKNALVVIDKKIRNLEKKKSKLDNLREEVRKSGKPLNEDQTQSLARYDDNNQQLDTFRELQKQFTSCSEDIRKCYRKILRQEQQAEQERLMDLERYRLLVGALETPDLLMDVIQDTEGLPGNCRDQLEQLRRLLFPLRWDQLPESARSQWPPSEEHLAFVAEQQWNLLHGRPLQVAPGAKELPECKELLDALLTSPYLANHPEALHRHKSLPSGPRHDPLPATTSSATVLKKESHLKTNAAPPPHTHSFKSTVSGVVAGNEAIPSVASVVPVPVVLPPDYQHGSSMSFVNSKITSGIVPPGPSQQQHHHHMPVNSTGIPHTGVGASSAPLASGHVAPSLPVSSGLPSLAVEGPPVAPVVMPLIAGAVPVSYPLASSGMGAFHAHGHGPNLIPSSRSHGAAAVDRERSSSFGGLMLDAKEDGSHVGAIGTHRGVNARAPMGDNAVAQGQSAWQNSRIGTFDPKNPEGDATDLSLAGPDAFHSHSPANDNQENRGFGDDMYKRREHEGNGYGFRGGAVRGGVSRGGRGGMEPPPPPMGPRTDRRSFDDSSERGRMGFPVDDRQRPRFPNNDRNMERAGSGPRGVPPPMGRYPGGGGDNRGPYRNSNEFEHNGNGDMMAAQNMLMGKEMGEKNPGNASESHTDYGLFHVPNPNYKGRTGLEPDRRYDRNRERERNEQREREERNRGPGPRRTGNIYM